MPYDPHLAATLRAALQDRPGLVEKKMFGGFCWMLNGNMLCGVEVGRYMFRVGKEQEEAALAEPGVAPMVLGGRKLGGFVWVSAEHASGEDLHTWIEFATRFVSTLAPKG